jgi:hypothetical protein
MRRAALALVVVLVAGACAGDTGTATTSTVPATTTLVAPTTTATASTTSTSSTTTLPATTTTTVITVEDLAGLGPACSPGACDPETVAAWPKAEYKWHGTVGVLGYLESAQYGGCSPPCDWYSLAGVFLGFTSQVMRYTSQAVVPGADIEDVTPVWFASFYFGDHPTTGEPIVGSFMIGAEAAENALEVEFIPKECWDVSSSDPCYEAAFAVVGTVLGLVTGEGYGGLPLEVGWAYHLQVLGDPSGNLQAAIRTGVQRSGLTVDEYARRVTAVQDFAALVATLSYNDALVDQMSGDDIALPDPGYGSFFLATSITNPPRWPHLDPGVWVVTAPDCPLCSQVLAAITAAAPNMPIHQVNLGSDLAEDLGAVSAPTAFAANDAGEQRGGAWVGQRILDDLAGLISQACRGLSGTDFCDGLTITLP